MGIGIGGAHLIGFKLPKGMNLGSLLVAGMVAGMGLTVALFVAGEAYQDPGLQGAAKMGPSQRGCRRAGLHHGSTVPCGEGEGINP